MRDYQLYTDDELLCLFKEDNEYAFNEVYRRYWKLLFVIASSHLKSSYAAEDIVHDVLASLWKNRRSLQVRSLQHYLASSTRYLVFRAIRKNLSERQYIESNADTATPFDLENTFHNKRLLEFVAREVDTLPERCREIFKYREKGLTNREIAMEMNITLKTVENQLNKALHRLRFSLKRLLQLFC
ncbi:MAG: sigma-70 family RNA polymerase sigma factor [Chitinophagaceae bacterium]|nr:sigma-70 family RNA polymerase sigma factor [Chitinophagaceae bacterium]MCW5927387.1 sigma-70 family RNA polymerase sigma factor [Chitinophagaceae bacterium]